MGVVVLDETPCGVDDRSTRSMVPTQRDRARAREARLEAQQVLDRRATKRVDRLVVITDDGHVPVPRADQVEQVQLGWIRVLELVDHEVAIARAKLGADRRMLAQEADCHRQLVAVVDGAGLEQQPLVRLVSGCQLAQPSGLARPELPAQLHRVRRRGRSPTRRLEGCREGREVGRQRALVLGPHRQVDDGPDVARGVGQRPVVVKRQPFDGAAEQDGGLCAADDAWLAGQSELEGMVADEAIAEGVEGQDVRAGLPVRNQHVHPRLHLLCRALGEGQGEDLLRARSLGGDQPGDPAGHHVRLPGAGSGQDEQWSVAMGHCLSLLAIQAAEELGHDVEIDRRAGWRGCSVSSRDGTGAGHAAILSPRRAS